jgi:hypothetical protein
VFWDRDRERAVHILAAPLGLERADAVTALGDTLLEAADLMVETLTAADVPRDDEPVSDDAAGQPDPTEA